MRGCRAAGNAASPRVSRGARAFRPIAGEFHVPIDEHALGSAEELERQVRPRRTTSACTAPTPLDAIQYNATLADNRHAMSSVIVALIATALR